jgi:hypothetical protein
MKCDTPPAQTRSWSWVDSASNRIEYREYLLGGRGCRSGMLTTLPLSYAIRPEIWTPRPAGTLWDSNGPAEELLCLYLYIWDKFYINKVNVHIRLRKIIYSKNRITELNDSENIL